MRDMCSKAFRTYDEFKEAFTCFEKVTQHDEHGRFGVDVSVMAAVISYRVDDYGLI